MRLKNIVPNTYTEAQKILHDILTASIDQHLRGFVTSRSDGALIGPFNILLHFPHLGRAVWSVFSALADHSGLPASVREVAILLTGAKCSALYELYSHESGASRQGMPLEKVATLAAGQRPVDLTREESVAFDLVSVLNRGGQIPNTSYRAAVDCFGEQGVAELACTVGCYSTIGFLLNAFDVSIPATETEASSLLQEVTKPLLDRGCRLLIDHYGRPDPQLGLQDPGFENLLSLGQSRRVWVDISGPYRNGDGQLGEDLSAAYISPLRETFGLDRMLWGSDWPCVRFEPWNNFESSCTFLKRVLPRTEDRRSILWNTPAELFEFK